MSQSIDLDVVRRRQALDSWLTDCRRKMGLIFPEIEFSAKDWPVKTLYKTDQADWNFTQSENHFFLKDISYQDTLRCLVAEMIIAGKPKHIPDQVSAYRQLAAVSPHQIFHLTSSDLRRLEKDLLNHGKENPHRAGLMSRQLSMLSNMIILLSSKCVLPRLGYHVLAATKAELNTVAMADRAQKCDGRSELLNRKMEAFNEAFNHMVQDHPALSAQDRVAICTIALSLCAPSRINEVLCMSIDDHVTIEDYGNRKIGEINAVHSAHQMLIVTMKGSKGADWSPKPVLSFMIDVFHYCSDIIKELSKRSRMLVEWYEQHPKALYLPPELEFLRGNAISKSDLRKIIQLSANRPNRPRSQTESNYFKELKDRQFKGPNPVLKQKEKRGGARDQTIDYLAWTDVESLLLKKVHTALDQCRRVTRYNHFRGKLSKMLFLFDQNEAPFLPSAVSYDRITTCIKSTGLSRKRTKTLSLFEKLNIIMPVGDKVRIAEMDTHDPRRWLTTMALKHGETLSDVLINKWANRSSLSQLKAYDFRTSETIAAQSAMPETERLVELADITSGLAVMEQLESQFGLQTAIVTAHDAGIAMTSMEAVAEAVENRPVANSSRGIIILYPQRFGVCFHQHHEKPCRNYSNDLSASCLTCNDAAVTKGHLPTNEDVRKTAALLFGSVVRHLENLAFTHNRNIADDPAALGEHMLTLVERGLSKDTLEQFAVHLIDEFHQINNLLKDRLLARRLEQSFVARGFVKLLDDPEVKNGALMKYHNPIKHAEPLFEQALSEHGGRDQVDRDEQALISKYPQFAAKRLGLRDERDLIAPYDEDED